MSELLKKLQESNKNLSDDLVKSLNRNKDIQKENLMLTLLVQRLMEAVFPLKCSCEFSNSKKRICWCKRCQVIVEADKMLGNT